MLDDEDIKEIMKALGSDVEPKHVKGGLAFETICHGSNSMKLYWYRESKTFMCFSCCGSMSLWDLVCNIQGWNIEEDFFKSVVFVANIKGVDVSKRTTRYSGRKQDDTELQFLRKHLYRRKEKNRKLKEYDSSILNRFEEAYPIDWYREGIDGITADKFDIRFDSIDNQAIIPHRGEYGELLGIRVRNFNPDLVEKGMKYTPLNLGGEWFSFQTGETFYGLYENGEDIESQGIAYLFESEKSVMLMDTVYDGHGYSVATMGTNFTSTQRDILINKGVKKVYVCYDREYDEELFDRKYDGTKEQRLMFGYFKKILKIYKMLCNYMEVNVIIDWDGVLPMKASPIDMGREVFEKLLREYCYTISDEKDLLELTGVDEDEIYGNE